MRNNGHKEVTIRIVRSEHIHRDVIAARQGGLLIQNQPVLVFDRACSKVKVTAPQAPLGPLSRLWDPACKCRAVPVRGWSLRRLRRLRIKTNIRHLPRSPKLPAAHSGGSSSARCSGAGHRRRRRYGPAAAHEQQQNQLLYCHAVCQTSGPKVERKVEN